MFLKVKQRFCKHIFVESRSLSYFDEEKEDWIRVYFCKKCGKIVENRVVLGGIRGK